MYRQLDIWGLSGLLLPDKEEAPSTSRAPGENRERRARRGQGEAKELLPPANARPLFEQALLSLMGNLVLYLMESLDELERRKVHLQDERYVAEDEYRDPIVWLRGRMPENQWKDLCQKFGKDPDSDSFELWDTRFVEPVGATQSPQEPLTTLIAVYVLADLPLEPLLEALHFAPEAVDRTELRRHIEGEKTRKRGRDGKLRNHQIPGLKTKAAHVAQVMSGKSVRRGPSTEELSPQEVNIVWYRQKRLREGIPDERIYHELKEKRGLTKSEYTRLKKFRLNAPSD